MARRLIVDTCALIPVEDYTADIAGVHDRLLAHVRRQGHARVAHDLIIGATAIVTARTLVTSDEKVTFDDLPGLDVIVARP